MLTPQASPPSFSQSLTHFTSPTFTTAGVCPLSHPPPCAQMPALPPCSVMWELSPNKRAWARGPPVVTSSDQRSAALGGGRLGTAPLPPAGTQDP